jgi:hypothetical protein
MRGGYDVTELSNSSSKRYISLFSPILFVFLPPISVRGDPWTLTFCFASCCSNWQGTSPPVSSNAPCSDTGRRMITTGFTVMLLAVGAGVGSGQLGLLLGFVGVLIGANLIAIGVRGVGDIPSSPVALARLGACHRCSCAAIWARHGLDHRHSCRWRGWACALPHHACSVPAWTLPDQYCSSSWVLVGAIHCSDSWNDLAPSNQPRIIHPQLSSTSCVPLFIGLYC